MDELGISGSIYETVTTRARTPLRFAIASRTFSVQISKDIEVSALKYVASIRISVFAIK